MRTLSVLTLMLLIACAPLDRRPPFGSAGYVDAVDAIGRAVKSRTTDRGAFTAGWARQQIEVLAGAPLAGYGDREGAPHTGVADATYVRAFAIGIQDSRAVVFAADLLLVHPRVVEAVRDGLDDVVDPGQIFFTASHTHSGLGGYVPGYLWSLAFGPYDQTYFAAVVRAHVTAARAALADMAPAKIGSATVRVNGLMKNRVETNGPVDDKLLVTRFERTDGRSAALWIYGCHAVTRSAANLQISADYPGDVAGSIEGQDVELLAFSAGGVGSSNPRHERTTHDWISRPLTRAVRTGLNRAKRNQRPEGRFAFAKAEVITPGFRYRVSDDVMVLAPPIEALVDMPKMTYGAVSIGNTVLLFMPGEMSGELTRSMRRNAARHGVRLAVTSFNGTYTGYIVPRRVYDLDPAAAEDMLHYETRAMSFFGPYGGDLMVNLGLRMARGVYAR